MSLARVGVDHRRLSSSPTVGMHPPGLHRRALLLPRRGRRRLPRASQVGIGCCRAGRGVRRRARTRRRGAPRRRRRRRRAPRRAATRWSTATAARARRRSAIDLAMPPRRRRRLARDHRATGPSTSCSSRTKARGRSTGASSNASSPRGRAAASAAASTSGQAPWGKAGFGTPSSAQQLADAIAEHEIDVLIAGPLTRLGMDEAGTLQHVRDFTLLIQDVRELSGRPVHVLLLHHENRGGTRLRRWEGAGDTLLHLQAQGHGKTRLYFQKARWAHAGTSRRCNLLWADGESFAVEERDELDDNTLADLILELRPPQPRHRAGRRSRRPRPASSAGSRRKVVRDRLLAGGRIVNVVKVDGARAGARPRPGAEAVAASTAPTTPPSPICVPGSDADGTQTASATGAGAELHLRPASRPIGTQDVDAAAVHPPIWGQTWPLGTPATP